jgi:hypothetical protein
MPVSTDKATGIDIALFQVKNSIAQAVILIGWRSMQ